MNDPYGQDTVGGCATMRSTPAIVYKATAENSPFGNPVPCDPNGVECIHDAADPRLREWVPTGKGLRARYQGGSGDWPDVEMCFLPIQCLHLLRGQGKKAQMPALIVSVALLAVGGCGAPSLPLRLVSCGRGRGGRGRTRARPGRAGADAGEAGFLAKN